MVRLVYNVWSYSDYGTRSEKRTMCGSTRKEIISKVNDSIWTDQTWQDIEWFGGDCD